MPEFKSLVDSNSVFEDFEDEYLDQSIEYDITASPNDFNIKTIYSFIDAGVVKIPGFQRHYVWDIKRASKLIESLIIGLPIPQLFLYEEGKNKFMVIDGQQRLMSIYYFIKRRFPRKEARAELRQVFNETGTISDAILYDNKYFTEFNLDLPNNLPQVKNKLHGLNYATLGEHQFQFDLRPLRNIIIKQNDPDNDSAIYEIFNRLNTGGVNLAPQEIRASLFHSKFYEMLFKINMLPEWRKLIKMPQHDLHMKDIETILRSFAMLISGDKYSPSLAMFLNDFAKKCRKFDEIAIEYLHQLFVSFIKAASKLPDGVFISQRTSKFSTLLFEATFTAALANCKKNNILPNNEPTLNIEEIKQLEMDETFQKASLEGTTKSTNVSFRLETAKRIITPLC